MQVDHIVVRTEVPNHRARTVLLPVHTGKTHVRDLLPRSQIGRPGKLEAEADRHIGLVSHQVPTIVTTDGRIQQMLVALRRDGQFLLPGSQILSPEMLDVVKPIVLDVVGGEHVQRLAVDIGGTQ